jgi:hypothetical protein
MQYNNKDYYLELLDKLNKQIKIKGYKSLGDCLKLDMYKNRINEFKK